MKTFEFLDTKHPDLARVVDRNGNWTHYLHKPTGTYLRGVTSILDEGYARPELEIYLKNRNASEIDEVLERAGDKGDKVHRAIDLMLTTGQRIDRNTRIYSKLTKQDELLTNEEWDCLLSFERFWVAHAPVLYISEASVFNLKEKYAGTIDALMELTKACDVKMCKCDDLLGQIGLFDWKTGAGIYANYSAQESGYAHSDNIKEYLPAKRKIQYLAILRIGTKHKTTGGYEFKTYDTEEPYQRFLSAKRIADYEYEPFNADRIVEIPDEITLSVTTYVKPTPKAKKIAKGRKKLKEKLTV